MLKRPLSHTGLRATPLGLAGSYGIGADDVVRAYEELGINYFFVTTKMDGIAEGVKRLVRAGHRDDIVIASGANVPTGWGVERAFANACKSLGVETIDIFELFWVQAHFYVTGKTWPAMRKLKEEGKVAALGVSIHDRALARRLVDELSLDMLMIRYNAAHRGAENEIFDTLPEKRPAIVSYTATRWGKLLSKHKDLGPMTPAECYRFAISHPKVDVVLCGARNWEELVTDAAGVDTGPLAAERLAEVRAFGDVVRASASGRIGF